MVMVNVDVGAVHLEFIRIVVIDDHDLARLSLTMVRDGCLLVLYLVICSQQLNLIRLNTTMSTTRVDNAIRTASFTHRGVGISGNGRCSANVVRRVGERGGH